MTENCTSLLNVTAVFLNKRWGRLIDKYVLHFTVVCLVAKPLNRSEARVDFGMKQTLLLFRYVNYSVSIANHMILSAIWDKSERVNFSKTNKIARARKASSICSH